MRDHTQYMGHHFQRVRTIIIVDRVCVSAHTHTPLWHMIIINVHTIRPLLPECDNGNYNYLGITIRVMPEYNTKSHTQKIVFVITSGKSPNAGGIFLTKPNQNYICLCVFMILFVRVHVINVTCNSARWTSAHAHLIALTSL